MQTQVLRLVGSDFSTDDLDQAAQVLADGGLVALPTETVYGIAARADRPATMARLSQLKERPAEKPYVRLLAGFDELDQVVGHLPRVGRKFIDRFWPGPLTLVLPDNEGGTIAVRIPAATIAQQIIARAGVPVVAPSANLAGQPPATTADQVLEALEGRIDLVVDGGPTPLGVASTVVRVAADDTFEILREGAVERALLEDLARQTILFVCTGNTCRSPLAEAVGRRFLARARGVDPGDLGAENLRILSAGTGALEGRAASPNSIEVAAEAGLDLSGHRARALTIDLCLAADVIYTMTLDQARVIVEYVPPVRDRVRLLGVEGRDIADPFGGSIEEYRSAFRQITIAVETSLGRHGFTQRAGKPDGGTR